MKLAILSPSQDENVDGPVLSLLRQITCKVDSPAQADVVIVPITRFDSFKFKEDLISQLMGKPWVLQDWSEFGWDWKQGTSWLWGQDRMVHPAFLGKEEYGKFSDFVQEHPPILTFQRELLESHRTDKIIPIEYCSWLPDSHGADTPEEYAKRPLECLFNWGRSSESRMYLHGAIFTEAPALGYDVLAQWDQIDKAIAENPKSLKWASIFAPHYTRIDVLEVQKFCRQSKVALIAPGAGQKTFRHGEVCQDAAMAIPKSKLAWSYPWDESNSIVLPVVYDALSAQDAVHIIRNFLMRQDIYQTYAAAMDNARRYEYHNYLRSWVMGNIQRVL